jgi:hypothetical protein
MCSCRKSETKIESTWCKVFETRLSKIHVSRQIHVTGKFVEPWSTSMKLWIMILKFHAPGAGTTWGSSHQPMETRSALKASETFQRWLHLRQPHTTSQSGSQHKPKRYINTAFCRPSKTAENPPFTSLTTFIYVPWIAQSTQGLVYWLGNRAFYFLNYLRFVEFEIIMAVFTKGIVL